MVDFKKLREVVSPTLILKLEIELNNSALTENEAADRLSSVLHNSYNNEFANFIVMLIRETRSSTWGLKTLEIKASQKE